MAHTQAPSDGATWTARQRQIALCRLYLIGPSAFQRFVGADRREQAQQLRLEFLATSDPLSEPTPEPSSPEYELHIKAESLQDEEVRRFLACLRWSVFSECVQLPGVVHGAIRRDLTVAAVRGSSLEQLRKKLEDKNLGKTLKELRFFCSVRAISNHYDRAMADVLPVDSERAPDVDVDEGGPECELWPPYGDAEAAMAAPPDPTRAPSPPPTVASDPLDLDAEDAAGPQADAEDRPPAGEGGLKRKRKKASGAQRAKKKAGKKAEEEDGGFTDKGRVAFKAEGGVLVTGGKRTCLPDALHMLLLSLSIPVDVEEVRTIMPADPNENTRFMAADNFVSQFGLTLQRVTSRFMSAKGGVALALLQASGYFVVQLRITAGKNDKDPDLHCVAYDGATVRDNYQWSKVKDLDEGDRASPASARKVFNSLFHRDLEVRIKNVYELMPL